MVCTLSEKGNKPNWCERHERYHNGHYAVYAVGVDEKSKRFRALWDKQKAGETQSKSLLRSLPLAKQCIHLGTENPPEKPGCGSCRTWGCAIHGKVKLSKCVNCTDWIRPATKWQPITTRHLLYHIYPVSNGHWVWNVEQLCGRLKAFNGQKIVAIVTDPASGRLPDPTGPNSPDNGRHIPGCDSAEMVKAEFRKRWPHDDITFLEFENDPSLREVKTFVPMLERVLSDDPAASLLYAQAKGTTRHHGHIARRWTEALYEIMLDHFPLADEQLLSYPVTGCFKKLGAGWSAEQTKSDWHYSGSWAWFRVAELNRRNWQKINMFWSGIEPYPSQQFAAKEAGCMFLEGQVPKLNLYSQKYWRSTVSPQFNQWRVDNAKYRTTEWPK